MIEEGTVAEGESAIDETAAEAGETAIDEVAVAEGEAAVNEAFIVEALTEAEVSEQMASALEEAGVDLIVVK